MRKLDYFYFFKDFFRTSSDRLVQPPSQVRTRSESFGRFCQVSVRLSGWDICSFTLKS